MQDLESVVCEGRPAECMSRESLNWNEVTADWWSILSMLQILKDKSTQSSSPNLSEESGLPIVAIQNSSTLIHLSVDAIIEYNNKLLPRPILWRSKKDNLHPVYWDVAQGVTAKEDLWDTVACLQVRCGGLRSRLYRLQAYVVSLRKKSDCVKNKLGHGVAKNRSQTSDVPPPFLAAKLFECPDW